MAGSPNGADSLRVAALPALPAPSSGYRSPEGSGGQGVVGAGRGTTTLLPPKGRMQSPHRDQRVYEREGRRVAGRQTRRLPPPPCPRRAMTCTMSERGRPAPPRGPGWNSNEGDGVTAARGRSAGTCQHAARPVAREAQVNKSPQKKKRLKKSTRPWRACGIISSRANNNKVASGACGSRGRQHAGRTGAASR